jgi:hypothetical protein
MCLPEHRKRAKDLSLADRYGRKTTEEELWYIRRYYDPTYQQKYMLPPLTLNDHGKWIEHHHGTARTISPPPIEWYHYANLPIQAEAAMDYSWSEWRNMFEKNYPSLRGLVSEKKRTFSFDLETNYAGLEHRMLAHHKKIDISGLNVDALLLDLGIKPQVKGNEMTKFRIKKKDGTNHEWRPIGDAGPTVSVAVDDKELQVGLKSIPSADKGEYTISIYAEDKPVQSPSEREINILTVDGAYAGILNRAVQAVKEAVRKTSEQADIMDVAREQVQNTSSNPSTVLFTDVLDAAVLNYYIQAKALADTIATVRAKVTDLAAVRSNKV